MSVPGLKMSYPTCLFTLLVGGRELVWFIVCLPVSCADKGKSCTSDVSVLAVCDALSLLKEKSKIALNPG